MPPKRKKPSSKKGDSLDRLLTLDAVTVKAWLAWGHLGHRAHPIVSLGGFGDFEHALLHLVSFSVTARFTLNMLAPLRGFYSTLPPSQSCAANRSSSSSDIFRRQLPEESTFDGISLSFTFGMRPEKVPKGKKLHLEHRDHDAWFGGFSPLHTFFC